MRVLPALAVLLVLGACRPIVPPADGLPIPRTPGAAPAAAATGTQLIVEPAHVQSCAGRDRVVATVRWQVADPAVSTVRIEVDSTQEPQRKRFAEGGASGEARTGDWVVAGTRFHLVDAASGRELATHDVGSQPCP